MTPPDTAARDDAAADDAVAVVGMSCRLPQAPDPGSFWRLLREGRSAVTTPPAGRWPDDSPGGGGPAGPGDPGVPSPARYGGFLDQVDRFDADFFGVSPREAAAMDPQQRLMLELSWEALEDAGTLPAALRDSGTAVFVGAILDDYATLGARRGRDAITAHTLTGGHRSMIANRISYTFGLLGPSMTIDTGQASSLVAVHMAADSLRRGESTLALAGGVNLNLLLDSTVRAERFGGLSPDGRCFTFDARANGYVRGEGGGLVVLKPLRAALADGDRVYCVIRGSAVNNDGDSSGSMGRPSRVGQEELVRAALADAH
ncbi:MAG TPA: polyketide synthase, partial [Streptomyces sp.]